MKVAITRRPSGILLLTLMVALITPCLLRAEPREVLEETLQKRMLTDVLEELGNTYQVLFSYNLELLSGVQVDFVYRKEESLKKVMNRLLANTHFTYETYGDKYLVVFKKSKQGIRDAKKLKRKIIRIQKLENKGNLSVANSTTGTLEALKSTARFISQKVLDKTLSGSILGSDGVPLIGATVRAKGTNKGALTDSEGRFQLEVPESVNTLIVSYIGYATQEIDIVGKEQITVTLEPSSTSLDEVVVVGYGTQKKSDLTGSLASVSALDFEQQPLTRMDQALQGRAPGVAVTQTSGAPGAGFKIRVRGANSISGNNNPLYVVDGLVVGDINSINVNDIASMEILKDASATAIYGSRGANGVVLITTKRGSKGSAKIEFETFHGISRVSQKLDVMTPSEFAEGVNFAEGNEIFTAEEIAQLRNGGGEDWQDRFFRDAYFSNVQISASGGGEGMDYYVSGNFYDADGTITDQNYRRYTLRGNINGTLSDKLKVGLNAFMSREENTGVRANLATGMTWDPTTPAFDDEGNYNFTPLKPGVGNGTPNPLVAPENNIRENFDQQVIANAYFDYELLDGLVLNISGGVEQLNINQNGYTSLLVNNTGNARVLNRDVNRYQNTNRLTYTFDQSAVHKIQVDAIHEQQFIGVKVTEAEATGFFSDNTTYKNLALGAVQRTNNNSTSESLQSFLGRVNYSILDKYLFTASIRADGSSKFQEDNRWGVFPSASLAWRVAEESFMESIPTINDLKLRASYGVTGSQAINPLATRSIPIIGAEINYPFTGQAATIGIAPSSQLANPDLTWETTTQTNVGLDLGLWNSRIALSFDLYQKNTTDLLLQRILPSFLGPTLVTENVGEVENRGFDIFLSLILLDQGDWNISSDLSFSRNVNEVIALVGEDEPLELGNIYYQNTFPVNPTRVEVGQPISAFRGYVFEGVYQVGEEDEAAQFGKEPGDAKYQDTNGDGVISTDDIVTVGDGNPDFTWGWNWKVGWKNLDLNFLLLGSQGNDIYNFQRMRMMGLGATQFHAVHADYNNRWTPNNPSQVPSGRDGTEFLSSQFIEDGSYVTLKTLALGYTFGQMNWGLKALRVYLSAENLFILTDYTGFDPESTASGNSDVDLGIDLNTYPINRSFSAGIKVTF
ncbi:MAG: SusC/RagA family TonB-linked outer membrane protein [Bacteroidota bacterium]